MVVASTLTAAMANYGRYNAVAQNVVQNISSGGVGSEGTVALGKISVTATVAMSFSLIR